MNKLEKMAVTTKLTDKGTIGFPLYTSMIIISLLVIEAIGAFWTSLQLPLLFQKILLIGIGVIALIKYSKGNKALLQGFSILMIIDALLRMILNIYPDGIIDALNLTLVPVLAALNIPLMQNKEQKENVNLRFDKNTPYAVELVDVVKDYVVGNHVVHALRGMSFKVKKGEFVAIMGPSGSGKSTTLNMIGALDRPTSGKVLIDGVDISKLSDNELAYLRNKKIGFIFQSFNLINRTTVLRNVELPAIVTGMSKKERIEKAKRLLKAVGLESEIYRSPKYLSGGQQQRVAIARALMNDPTIILADEPTGNLDSKTGAEVMHYLKKMNKEFGTTVIVVTHDREVAEYADRIIHIRDGKVLREEIVEKPRE